MKWKNKCKVFGIRLLTAYALFFSVGMQAEAGTLYESGYVRFSPDGQAWTFAEKLPDGYEPYASGPAVSREAGVYFDSSDSFSTGITSVREEVGVGQHLYTYDREGEVPVGAWKVVHPDSYCSHQQDKSTYPDTWHGLVCERVAEPGHVTLKDEATGHFLSYRDAICGWRYYSGWNAICADCGGKVTDRNIYGSLNAVKSITSIDTSLALFYQCPSCSHLEQAAKEPHECLGVSYNMYVVRYYPNADGGTYGGFMADSRHMYNNETIFEGDEIVPQTTLSLNNYTRIGYAFKGWNTEPDGSGTFYSDGEEILNLTDENYDEDTGSGIVILYAQWETSRSTLVIDAAGGTYEGVAVFTKTAGYGTKYKVDESLLVPPEGCTITYKTLGGNIDGQVDPKEKIAKAFDGWDNSELIHGRMKNGVYAFLGADGTTDKLTATYTSGSVVLPQPKKSGYAFGGWFLDEACETQPVGMQGDVFTPAADKSEVTLYAKWVGLILWSTPNLATDGGKGGVNLQWAQADGSNKIYRIYQSPDGARGTYKQINVTSQSAENMEVSNTLFQYNSAVPIQIYEVKHNGYYSISAIGGSGAGYGEHVGGNGGKVTATFYLEKGDRLAISCGKQGGGGVGTAGEGANGGQETVVESEKKGVLLIGGGGGGALQYADGKCGGGLATTIAAGTTGQSGYAGGGNGAVPGNAGTYMMAHTHVPGCYHVHSGDAVNGGDCYTEPATIVCGEYRHDGDTWYGFNAGGPNGTCVQCHQPAEGHLNTHYLGKWSCKTCGHVKEESNPDFPAPVSHNISGWDLSCGMTEATLTCNIPESVGAITAAQGGMNYVASSRIYVTSNTTDSSDAAYGNGRVWIDVTGVGATEVCRLEGVSANDKAAPGKITSYDTEGAGGNQVLVTWEKPVDEGTPYYHQAKSYALNTGDECESNVRRDVITTGVKGYYYIVNTSADTLVNETNAQNKNDLLAQDSATDTCEIRVAMTEDVQYLHLVAVDVAGNLDKNKTIHIPIDNDDLEFPIMTEQISVTDEIGVRDYGSVYRVDGTNSYYVRADGQTPFLLSGTSYMDGLPRANYMIDYQQYHIEMESSEQAFITRIPYSSFPNNTEEKLDATKFVRRVSGSSILTDAMYIGGTRSEDCKSLDFYQAFTVDEDYNGKQLFVMPRVGITINNSYAEEDVVYSAEEKDALNGVTLIPDGEAPIIGGMEAFEGVNIVNREIFSGMNLTVRDELSGVEKCKVTIVRGNLKYYVVVTKQNLHFGNVSIDFTEDREVFNGNFKIVIEAYDNVGNSVIKQYGSDGIELSASVSRILEPHAPVFKCGESGILTINACGDVKRIEVEFPGEMVALCPELNQTFHYAEEGYDTRSEELQFMVPLYTPEGDYTITVRAIGEKSTKEVYPTLTVIEGGKGILGELRTRLR